MNWSGDYFQVDSARLWDIPDVPVGIAVAMTGGEAHKGIDKFAKLADHLVAVEPDDELVHSWHVVRARPPAWPGVAAWSGKYRCAGVLTATPPSNAHMISSAGSPAGGRSMPTCRRQPVSTARASSCAARTSPTPSPAGRT